MEKANNTSENIVPDHIIDITSLICPMTFVRTKLRLEQIAPGETLQVRLRGDEPLHNVPRSAEQHGHTILSLTPESPGDNLDGVHLLVIRREDV
ncbi:MAG: sulfurtransferase TusA family protein [Rhodospirillales bacterium]|nr:sulfurtransferase TusA family protein [Rhodospirillales bacterium]